MDKMVAIMAEPCEIFNLIIFSILIYVVRGEHPLIRKFASLAYCRNTVPLKHTPIGIEPIYPICMFGANKLRVPPCRLA